MKRYWKILAICLVTLLTIGTFYIQSSLAAKGDVKIDFENVSGNAQEANNLTLYGDFIFGNRHQSLEITKEKTVNRSNESFYENVTKGFVGSNLRGLINQYKNFMRGKDFMDNYYFEDEKRLVYANIKGENFFQEPTGDFFFDIEVLNKKSGEITSIQLEVPDKEKYNWMYVEEVQVVNDGLKVITHCFVKEGNNELREFSFNINQQKLVNDKTIISATREEKGRTEVRIINNAQSMKPKNYLLIKKETFEDKMVSSDGGMNEVYTERSLVASEILVYNIKTNQIKKLTAPEEILTTIEQSSTIFDSILYVQSHSEMGVEINRYDLEKEEWINTLTFDLGQNQNVDQGSFIKLMNGKLYMISLVKNEYKISIKELKTGKSLYEGKLKVNKPKENEQDYKLYFHDIVDVH